jgi:predicted helicase
MAKILYHAVPGDWRKEQKYSFLEKTASVAGVKWTRLTPDKRGNWITNDSDEEFDSFLPIGSKNAKAGMSVPTIFRTYSLGVSTNRDAVVYDFDAKRLAKRVEQFADDYNAELHRWQKKGRPADVDNFVSYEKVKWSRNLKRWFRQEDELKFKAADVRDSAYRPFTLLKLHYARMFVDEVGTTGQLVPTKKAQNENKILCLNVTVERPFCCLATNAIPNLVYTGGFGCATYALSQFTYYEDGKERRDNVTPKARTLFQIFYADDGITAADIFHYVYAVLHHPAYRTRFAENLKRDLPRIPFIGAAAAAHSLAPSDGERAGVRGKHKAHLTPTLSPHPMGGEGENAAAFFPLSAIATMQGEARPAHNPAASAKLFHAFADAGKKLAALHVNYESAKEYKLKRQENKEVKLDWRVEAMKLSKDKASLFYNDFLTLSGIPPEVFAYKLGNRSALEWVIDQYRVTRDEQGNISSDPNRMDDEEYIVRLIGQVITVSLETMKVVSDLPELKFGGG